MDMNFGETMIGIFTVCGVFGTLCVFFIARAISNRRGSEADFREMQRTVKALNDSVQRIEGRLTNVETIVTSADYRAGERITRAVEQGYVTGSAAPERPRVAN